MKKNTSKLGGGVEVNETYIIVERRIVRGFQRRRIKVRAGKLNEGVIMTIIKEKIEAYSLLYWKDLAGT